MVGNNSDLLYFSALLVLAIFAMPAIGGACFLSSECPIRVSDCHEERSEQTDLLCCGVTAAPIAKQQSVDADPSSLVLDTWARQLSASADVVPVLAPLQSNPRLSRVAPLFVAHSSYLL